MADITVRPMTPDDADRVLAIYQAGLDAGNASFETTAPTWTAFDAAKLPDHRLVAVDADGIVPGWVAVAPTSRRRRAGRSTPGWSSTPSTSTPPPKDVGWPGCCWTR